MGVRPFSTLYFCKKSSHIILSSEFFSIAKNGGLEVFIIYVLHIFAFKIANLQICSYMNSDFANVYL